MKSQVVTLALLLISVSLSVSHEPDKTLQGHLRPLGEQGPVLPVDEVEGFLKPKEFVEKYVLKNKPLLMRGAGKMSPAWEKWTDEYLAKKAPPSPEGDVVYEIGKKETRAGKGGTMHMSKFIAKYNKSDIYMVNDIPEWMMPDLTLPLSLQCDDFVNGGLDTAVMWFSSGGTKSVLHHDSYENINCIYRGSKTLVFINTTKYKDLMPDIITKESGTYNDKIDVDKIDLKKFPVFSKLEYHIGTMHPGDCLYIPFLWTHQVGSSDTSNMAVNVWWPLTSTKSVDLSKCKKELDEKLTYDKVQWLNTEGVMNNWAEIKHFIKMLKINAKAKPMDEAAFIHYIIEGCDIIKDNKLAMSLLKESFEELDKNKDKKLDKNDFPRKAKMKHISKLFNRGSKFDNILLQTIQKHPEKCQGLYMFRSNAPAEDERAENEDEPPLDDEAVDATDAVSEDLGLDEPHDEL